MLINSIQKLFKSMKVFYVPGMSIFPYRMGKCLLIFANDCIIFVCVLCRPHTIFVVGDSVLDYILFSVMGIPKEVNRQEKKDSFCGTILCCIHIYGFTTILFLYIILMCGVFMCGLCVVQRKKSTQGTSETSEISCHSCMYSRMEHYYY